MGLWGCLGYKLVASGKMTELALSVSPSPVPDLEKAYIRYCPDIMFVFLRANSSPIILIN
jgi:hypothetical protein